MRHFVFHITTEIECIASNVTIAFDALFHILEQRYNVSLYAFHWCHPFKDFLWNDTTIGLFILFQHKDLVQNVLRTDEILS